MGKTVFAGRSRDKNCQTAKRETWANLGWKAEKIVVSLAKEDVLRVRCLAFHQLGVIADQLSTSHHSPTLQCLQDKADHLQLSVAARRRKQTKCGQTTWSVHLVMITLLQKFQVTHSILERPSQDDRRSKHCVKPWEDKLFSYHVGLPLETSYRDQQRLATNTNVCTTNSRRHLHEVVLQL